jgi:hypothetical protein
LGEMAIGLLCRCNSEPADCDCRGHTAGAARVEQGGGGRNLLRTHGLLGCHLRAATTIQALNPPMSATRCAVSAFHVHAPYARALPSAFLALGRCGRLLPPSPVSAALRHERGGGELPRPPRLPGCPQRSATPLLEVATHARNHGCQHPVRSSVLTPPLPPKSLLVVDPDRIRSTAAHTPSSGHLICPRTSA